MPSALETERVVVLGDEAANHARTEQYAISWQNRISTAKYTLWDFVPRNLFEQLMRAANCYFLILLILQFFPQIASLSPVTTAIPLVIVLSVTAVKDANDDIKRHRSDRQVNNRVTRRLENGRWVKVQWKSVVVGDTLLIQDGDPVPADVLILASSEGEGDCYVFTADLDGETYLKKHLATSTHETLKDVAEDDPAELSRRLHGTLHCEPPNPNLTKFDGYLEVGQDKSSLSGKNVIYRGCVLRNTEWIVASVVFAGGDTKLMRNAGQVRFKRTHIDQRLNTLVVIIFIILFCMCVLLAILSAAWQRSSSGEGFNEFVGFNNVEAPDTQGLISFFAYLILLSNLVPISLYVSVEMIRLGQSYMIGQDQGMYDEETDTPAVARTTTLNEELGQIDYVFSDKTGTLTQNIMRFLQCSVGERQFGKEADLGGEYHGFVDNRLQAALDDKDDDVLNFFRFLAVCHTVRPDSNHNGKKQEERQKDKGSNGTDAAVQQIEYTAQSPDEKALVEAARDVGVVFLRRTQTAVYIRVNGEEESYKLLNIIEFSSSRKRMTIVVRDKQDRILAMTKGADTIIRDLLSQDSRQRHWPTAEQQLHSYAKDGLRTLVLAQRVLDEEWYAGWQKKYEEADVAIDNRQEKVAEVALELERNLEYVGCTAIEDKLQKDVPATIANLMRAGIRVVVLTGDKRETAINIGYSCRLLRPEMEPLLSVSADSVGEAEEAIANALDEAKRNRDKDTGSRPLGLVIDGPSLTYILPPTKKEIKTITVSVNGEKQKYWDAQTLEAQKRVEKLFVETCNLCNSVLCCRVSPLQKAQVVNLFKNKGDITLAIGDGANDVSMIKAAHVGIGISGLEGRQAVLASDYSISQFRFLQRLLLIHGRWSYVRMCAFLRYFFYKNFAYAWAPFFFAFFSAYSAMSIYDPVFISTYNVVFTSLPILVVGILEQDVDQESSLQYPFLYKAGPKNALFDGTRFFMDLLRGIWHGAVIFFGIYFSINVGGVSNDGLDAADLFLLGPLSALLLVVIVNLELALETQYWTWMNVFTILVGPLCWFILFPIQYAWDDWIVYYQSRYFGSYSRLLGMGFSWFLLLLTVVVAIVPSWLHRLGLAYFKPTPTTIVREKIKLKNVKSIEPEPFTEIERSRLPTNTFSYDFSQEDHVGRDLFPPSRVDIAPASVPVERWSGITIRDEDGHVYQPREDVV